LVYESLGGDAMRHLDAFPRFLLKLPNIVCLSVAILSVAFFLILYMMVSPAARTPLMLAIPVALVRHDMLGQVRGSGLGLYISQQLVEAMGGRIWAESAEIPGQGSCFCFTLLAHVPLTSMNLSLREEILH
jgi:hypothetical protein